MGADIKVVRQIMSFEQMHQETLELTLHRFAIPFGQALDLLNECIQIDLFKPALSQKLSGLIGPSDKVCVL